MKPCIESVIVPNKSAAVVSTFGKYFPFGCRNAAQMEDRDNEEDLRKGNAIASNGEEEWDTEFGGDVTLLHGSDDLLRRCDPCLSRFVSNRCMVFSCSQQCRRPCLECNLCKGSTSKSCEVEYAPRISGANTQG
jgi:hypothetical protein